MRRALPADDGQRDADQRVRLRRGAPRSHQSGSSSCARRYVTKFAACSHCPRSIRTTSRARRRPLVVANQGAQVELVDFPRVELREPASHVFEQRSQLTPVRVGDQLSRCTAVALSAERRAVSPSPTTDRSNTGAPRLGSRRSATRQSRDAGGVIRWSSSGGCAHLVWPHLERVVLV
jgi:hypothetical protein